MSNLKRIASIVLLSLPVLVTAQKITWCKVFKDTTGGQVKNIFGQDANGFYVTRNIDPHHDNTTALNPQEIVLEKYDFAGNKIFGKYMDVSDGPKKDYLADGLFYMKDNMMLIMYGP